MITYLALVMITNFTTKNYPRLFFYRCPNRAEVIEIIDYTYMNTGKKYILRFTCGNTISTEIVHEKYLKLIEEK